MKKIGFFVVIFFLCSFSSVFAQNAGWYWIPTPWQVDTMKTNVKIVIDTSATSVNAPNGNSAVGLFSVYGKTMNLGATGETPINILQVYFEKDSLVLTPFPDSITVSFKVESAENNLLGILPMIGLGGFGGQGSVSSVGGINEKTKSVYMYPEGYVYYYNFSFKSFQSYTRVGNTYVYLEFILYPMNYQDTAIVYTGATIEVGDFTSYIGGKGTILYSFQIPTGVSSIISTTPLAYQLSQNYPNPFNPSTRIAYDVAKSGDVTLSVYNTLGQEVNTLVDGYQSAGHHIISFDASRLASGTYFYILTSGSQRIVKKMVLLK